MASGSAGPPALGLEQRRRARGHEMGKRVARGGDDADRYGLHGRGRKGLTRGAHPSAPYRASTSWATRVQWLSGPKFGSAAQSELLFLFFYLFFSFLLLFEFSLFI
jgi:hypothetical protein